MSLTDELNLRVKESINKKLFNMKEKLIAEHIKKELFEIADNGKKQGMIYCEIDDEWMDEKTVEELMKNVKIWLESEKITIIRSKVMYDDDYATLYEMEISWN